MAVDSEIKVLTTEVQAMVCKRQMDLINAIVRKPSAVIVALNFSFFAGKMQLSKMFQLQRCFKKRYHFMLVSPVVRVNGERNVSRNYMHFDYFYK